jgi:hypothetical protein
MRKDGIFKTFLSLTPLFRSFKLVKMIRPKAISFKTAFYIVVALHVLAYVAVVQFSSWRAKQAKIARELKRTELLNSKVEPNNWPVCSKPKIKTYPPRPTPSPKVATISPLVAPINRPGTVVIESKRSRQSVSVTTPIEGVKFASKTTTTPTPKPTPKTETWPLKQKQRAFPIITKERAYDIIAQYNDLARKVERLDCSSVTKNLCKRFVDKGTALALMQTTTDFNEEVFNKIAQEFNTTKQDLLRCLRQENYNRNL